MQRHTCSNPAFVTRNDGSYDAKTPTGDAKDESCPAIHQLQLWVSQRKRSAADLTATESEALLPTHGTPPCSGRSGGSSDPGVHADGRMPQVGESSR